MEELIIADEFSIDDSVEDDSSSNATNNNSNDDVCQCQFECDVECQFKYTEWTISIVFIKPGVFPHCISHVLKLTELLCADSRCWMFHCYSMKIKIIILNVEILWKFTSQEEHPMTG